MANDQRFAKTCKNPRFSLDPVRLYANLLRVKIWLIGPGGGGRKAGISPCGVPVFPARVPNFVVPNWRWGRRWGASGLALPFLHPVHPVHPVKIRFAAFSRLHGRKSSRDCVMRKDCGRRIAEGTAAKYAKYAKGGSPLFAFFSWFAVKKLDFAAFCAKSMEVLIHEPFTRPAEFFQAKSSQTQSNPVKPKWKLDAKKRTRPTSGIVSAMLERSFVLCLPASLPS